MGQKLLTLNLRTSVSFQEDHGLTKQKQELHTNSSKPSYNTYIPISQIFQNVLTWVQTELRIKCHITEIYKIIRKGNIEETCHWSKQWFTIDLHFTQYLQNKNDPTEKKQSLLRHGGL